MHDRMASGTDILYLHPSKPAADFKDYARVGAASPYLLMPVGVPGMINLLREHGFRVTGLNVPMEILINPQFNLVTWLGRQRGVSLVAIDLHWYEHAFGALDVARVCKQVYPDVPVVIGGFTASCFATEILSQFPQVDFIIRGDAERPLLDLARRVCRQEGPALSEIPNLCFRSDGRVVENEQSYCVTTEDLNHLNCVDIDFLVHAEQYYGLQFTTTERVELISMTPLKGHWLTIGRGCRFRCSFCGGGRESHATIAGRGGIVPRSVEQVVDDLARLQRMGIRQVSFNLDPAIMGDAYWSRLFAEMRRRKVRIGIYNECFQLPSEDFLREFVETAEIVYSELAISPLSGSEKVRQLNGKHFTNSQLLRVLSILRPYEVPIFLYFSLNLPGEDEQTFRHTLQLAKSVCQSYPPRCLRMINMCHTIDPCCPMSQDPHRYGIEVDFKTFIDYYRYCQETPVPRKDVDLGAWRGYKAVNRKPRSLERMAQQWDAFCAGQRARCYPVPRMW